MKQVSDEWWVIKVKMQKNFSFSITTVMDQIHNLLCLAAEKANHLEFYCLQIRN